MKKYLAVAAILALGACGSKQEATTTADSVGAGAAMPADTMSAAPTDSAAAAVDTSMVRDSASN